MKLSRKRLSTVALHMGHFGICGFPEAISDSQALLGKSSSAKLTLNSVKDPLSFKEVGGVVKQLLAYALSVVEEGLGNEDGTLNVDSSRPSFRAAIIAESFGAAELSSHEPEDIGFSSREDA